MIPEQTNNLTEGKHGTVSCLNLSSGLWKYTIYLTPTPNVHVIFPYSTLCTSYTRVPIYVYMWSRACYIQPAWFLVVYRARPCAAVFGYIMFACVPYSNELAIIPKDHLSAVKDSY